MFNKKILQKMKNIKYIFMTIMLFAAMNQLSSQTIINDSETKNRAYLRVGIEPTTMITFGYQRNLNVGFLNRNLTSYAEWGTMMYDFSFDNSELKIGGIIPVFETGDFKVVNNLYLSAGSVTTQNFDSRKFAVGDEIAVGFYKKSWFFAATAEYEKIYLNLIEPTEHYRITYYEDVEDGWYTGGGGMFQFGVEGGISVRQKYDIHLEIKMPFTEKFNSYGGSPLHVNLGLGYRF